MITDNDHFRLTEAERELDHQLDQDTLPKFGEYEIRVSKWLADLREQDKQPKRTEPWTGDPTTPLYMRPPFNK